ncbi:MAG TPA: peptidoglycan-binding domain-containing protein [Candidatus Acidoferrum sp.]|nr:peptidoglycan-binding domain-containing protein [Candidatus Acidoferrum sp.]
MAANLSFRGQTISAGSKQSAYVSAIQARLNNVGCGPAKEDGIFGPETLEAVELFQARSVDEFGTPLKVDGRVGPMTWATLFAIELEPPVVSSSSKLLSQALVKADLEVGVREQPLGSNRGPRVDQYLRSVGLDPTQGSFAWCAAFVYFCFNQACVGLFLPCGHHCQPRNMSLTLITDERRVPGQQQGATLAHTGRFDPAG